MTKTLLALLLVVSATAAPDPQPVEAEAAEVDEVAELLRAQELELAALREELGALREALLSQSPEAEPAPPTEALPAAEAAEVSEAPERRRRARDVSDRVTFAGKVHVREGERISDAIAFGGSIEVEGEVTGDAVAFGGSVRVRPTGVVQGDAVAFGGRVQVDEGGVVHGDRVNLGISGGRSSDRPSAEAADLAVADRPHKLQDALSDIRRRLIFLLAFAGLSVLLVGLFPRRVGRVAREIELHPIRTGVVGLILTGLLVTAATLFAITLIGLPLTLVLLMMLAVAWLLGFVATCQVLGERLPFRDPLHGRWAALALGTLLFTFLGSLHWIAWPVLLVASTIGIGAALGTRFGGAAPPRS